MQTVEIDQQARERAEGWVGDFLKEIADAEAVLVTLGGFIGGGSISSSVVGSIGIKVGEMREQVPALLQAIRDLDPSYVPYDIRAQFPDGRVAHLKHRSELRGEGRPR